MVQHASIDHTGITGSGGGALVFLQKQDASSSAQLDFTSIFSATYDEYMFEGVALAPATNAVNLLWRAGTGGGPTYDTGGNYYCALRSGTGTVSVSGATGTPQQGSSNGAITNADAAATSMMLAKTIANNAGYGLVSFTLRLINPQSASNMKHNYGNSVWHNGTEVFMANVGGLYASTTAMTAVRFFMSSGNIASGSIRCYGIVKA